MGETRRTSPAKFVGAVGLVEGRVVDVTSGEISAGWLGFTKVASMEGIFKEATRRLRATTWARTLVESTASPTLAPTFTTVPAMGEVILRSERWIWAVSRAFSDSLTLAVASANSSGVGEALR